MTYLYVSFMFTEELIELFMCDACKMTKLPMNGNTSNSAKGRVYNNVVGQYFIISNWNDHFNLVGWLFGPKKWHNHHFGEVKLQIFAVAHWLRYCFFLLLVNQITNVEMEQRNADRLRKFVRCKFCIHWMHSHRAKLIQSYPSCWLQTLKIKSIDDDKT